MWLQNIDQHVSNDVKKLLIGNKCDMISNRVINHETVKILLESSRLPYVETSAKSATNVQQAFNNFVSEILTTRINPLPQPVNQKSESKTTVVKKSNNPG